MIPTDDVLHFTFRVGPLLFDARPLFDAIDKACTRTGGEGVKINCAVRSKLGELSLHLATRSQLLVLCLKKLESTLVLAIESATFVSDSEVLVPLDEETTYSLLLFVDSFLFESFAYDEVLQKFFKCALIDVLGVCRKEARSTYEKIRDQSGTLRGETWMEFLAGVRNNFTHAATPWPAIDRTQRAKGAYDVVIMQENITDFTSADEKKYFRAIVDLNSAWKGLANTAQNCQNYLLDRINQVR